MNPARSLVSADYDQGLATCRDFLKRAGPEQCQRWRAGFEAMQKDPEDKAKVVGTFALLGLLAAELSIEEPDDG